MPNALSESQKRAEVLRLFDEIDENVSEEPPSGCRGSSSIDVVNNRFRSFLINVTKEAESGYSDDGGPVLFCTLGTGKIKLCGYRWAPEEALIEAGEEICNHYSSAPGVRTLYWSRNYAAIDWRKVKGVLVHAHGITETARSGLIRCKATEVVLGPKDNEYTAQLTPEQHKALCEEVSERGGYAVAFKNSWLDELTQAGYVVFALDNQGHGYSQGWKGDRCNVERLAHMEEDFMELLRSLILTGEVPQTPEITVPLFVSGLSLGGLITARGLEIGFERQLLCTPKRQVDNTPIIFGWCLLCPAISGERLKRKFPNQILLPITNVVSRATPSMRVVALERNTPYPFINEIIDHDPLVYQWKLPIRISAESVLEMDRILPNAHHLPDDLSIILIQSKYDTMTDPEGSALFMETVKTQDKETHWLDYSWHWLAKEPGYGCTIRKVIAWIDSKSTIGK